MKNYLSDKNSLSVPWLESPFYQHLILNDDTLSMREKAMCAEFADRGFIEIDLELSDLYLDIVKVDMDMLLEEDVKTQALGYQYTEHKRIFEGWKKSRNILYLALHDKILKTLQMLYNRTPIPFQTINFTHGSNQPLHSDSIHFHTIPERWVAGVWIALEDMDEDNGSLSYVEGSHKLPFYDFQYMNLNKAEANQQFNDYYEYEEFIRHLVTFNNMKTSLLKCKRGTAMIWASNLLHGGSEIKDVKRTRYSQATHYYFEGCSHYYAPMFSDLSKGIIAEKDLSTKNFREEWMKQI